MTELDKTIVAEEAVNERIMEILRADPSLEHWFADDTAALRACVEGNRPTIPRELESLIKTQADLLAEMRRLEGNLNGDGEPPQPPNPAQAQATDRTETF